MIFSKEDLLNLKWSLLAFFVSLAIGGTAIWLGSKYDFNALKERQAAQKSVIAARNLLSSTQSDLDNMSTYSLEYDSLVTHKVVGTEQRLDWIEGLEKLRQQHIVLDFRYTIEPQQPYTTNPPLDSGNFEINISKLSLDLDLLHEDQLIEFLEAMRVDMKGWFIVDHCSIERPSDSIPVSESSKPTELRLQLKANCAGGWVTLKRKS